MAQDFAHSVLPRVSQSPGRVYKRFLRAFTHKGFIDYAQLNVSGSKLMLSIEKGADFSIFADELSRLASQAGYEVILGKDALTPRRNSHLILPGIGVVFTDEGTESRLDRLDRATYRAALAAARKRLAAAKALHDELEAVYIPTIDFSGLTALAQQHIRELKDEYTHRKITL